MSVMVVGRRMRYSVTNSASSPPKAHRSLLISFSGIWKFCTSWRSWSLVRNRNVPGMSASSNESIVRFLLSIRVSTRFTNSGFKMRMYAISK